MADDDVFWQLLQGLAHGAHELQFALQDGVRLKRPCEQLALQAQKIKQVLSDASLQTRREVAQESAQLLLEIQTVVRRRDEGLHLVLPCVGVAHRAHRLLGSGELPLQLYIALVQFAN